MPGDDLADHRRQQRVARRQADARRAARRSSKCCRQLRQAQRARCCVAAPSRDAHLQRDVACDPARRQQRQLRLAPGRRGAVAHGQDGVAAAAGRPRRRCPAAGRPPARSPGGRSRTSPTAAPRTAAGWRPGRRATIAMRLPHRLAVEGAMRRRPGAHFAFALVEHLDVAAERDRGDHVLGAVLAAARPQRPCRSRPRSAAP